MRFPVFLLGGFLILWLGACASTPAPAPQPAPEQSEREELVRQVPEVEPEWAVQGAHPDDEEFLYFVGYSGKHAEERNAVAEARQAAGNEFVEYCGVESKTFSKFLSVTYGLSSEVKDATESGVSGSEQQSEAYFRRLRVVGRLASEYRVLRGTQEQRRFWRMKVLVKVPRSEYDAVLAWKQKREDEAKALKLAQEQQAETLLSQQLASAKSSASEGDFLGALKQLQQFRKTAPEQPTPKREGFLTEADGLETQWLGGVQLRLASAETQTLEPGQTPEPFLVMVELRMGELTVPIPNFPLLLFNQNAQLRGITGPDGMAKFQLPPSPGEGTLNLHSTPDPERLRDQVPEEALASLQDRKVTFRVVVQVPFLKQRVKNDFPLTLASSVKGNLRVGDAFGVSGGCAKRCRIRLYYWDGQSGTLVHETQGPKLTKGEVRSLAEGVNSDAPGRFTLIALATAGAYPDAVAAGTAYPATEFAVVLKNFRSMKGAKAEEHLEITVQK